MTFGDLARQGGGFGAAPPVAQIASYGTLCVSSREMLEQKMVEHKPHPHIERRKKFADVPSNGGFNQWLAVKVTAAVGSMWCAYAFAILCFISLPEAIKGGTATLITWICQTFLQLVLLSIIIVGQNIQSRKSQEQLEQTYKDAEALLEIHDETHHLIQANEELTEKVHSALKLNTELTEQLNEVVNQEDFTLPRGS